MKTAILASLCLLVSANCVCVAQDLLGSLPPPPKTGGTSVPESYPQLPAATSPSATVANDMVQDDVTTSPVVPVEQPTGSALIPGKPAIVTNGLDNRAEALAHTSGVRAADNIRNLSATIGESAYPETVRRHLDSYVTVNVPPGWKLVQIPGLRYNPAPVIPLANGETFSVETAPWVLVPASDVNRVPVNPRSLQVLHNFVLANEELMRQVTEALQSPQGVTRLD